MKPYLLLFLLVLNTFTMQATGDFPIKIVNKTNNAAIKNIYIVTKGINPETGNQCFIEFKNNDHVGICVDITKGTDSKAFAYDYTFFKNNIMHLPNLTSGRIYVSINNKLTMPVVVDANNRLGIADPSPYNKTDPNYDLFFDKIEFTYIGNNTWTNPTAVDFFELPLSIEQNGHTFGLTESREKIVSTVAQAFDAAPSKAWQKLIVKNEQGTVLRILAPGRDDNFFDPNYLTGAPYNYVNDVWDYYTKNSIIIDCSELHGNQAAPQLKDYQFEGRVKNGIFEFTNRSKDYTVSLEKPSSNSFFLGAQGVFDAPNNTPKAIIVRNLSAAWCVGLLPAEHGATLNRTYFDTHKSQFYTDNPRLSAQAKNKGPFYNLYGKAIHQLSKTVYTWAYDDVFGYDGTNASTATKAATLTIGDMAHTKIP
ncbi:MAG: beta-1,3-glucanase family protein [Candidatus Babeliales bacterium]